MTLFREGDAAAATDTHMIKHEFWGEVAKSLPEECIPVVTMIYIDHMSTRDIGKALGIDHATVIHRHERALALLKENAVMGGYLD